MNINYQTIIQTARRLQWILPFFAFCIGYFCLQFFIVEHNIAAPQLIGKNILQAIKLCSELKLNLRIIAEKEIADAQPGTIIQQNPAPGTSIKQHQSLFIAITKQPDLIISPNCIDKSHEAIEKICSEQNIKYRAYVIPAQIPAGQCFGQIPLPGEPLTTKKINCYIAAAQENMYLFPDFTNMQLYDVIQFLERYGIGYDVYEKDKKLIAPYKKNCTISYQKPLAGTFVAINTTLYVQLQVQCL